ncbi:hypothetical protein AB2T90_11180 [Clostridium butyricum]|uniref:hypothetical protein n=1 Tax=Clostridium butyricum TaxID=1492 RepID=UPI0034668E5F
MDNKNIIQDEKEPIFTIEDARNNIDRLIFHEKKNNKLIEQLTIEFTRKGLGITIPKELFLNKIEVDKLTETELIAFCITTYDFFREDEIKNKRDYILDIFPRNYWYSKKIDEVRLMQNIPQEVSSWLVFPLAQKINDYEFQVVLRPEKVDYMESNRLYRYDKNIQRISKVVKLPNGERIIKENYNPEGLKDLKERFLNKKRKLMTTQISFTLLDIRGKKGECYFDKQYSEEGIEVGTLRINVCFDESKDNYFVPVLNDGAHRWKSFNSAYNKAKRDGVPFNNSLTAMFRIATEDEAKQFTADSFKQNSCDKMYVKNLEDTPINKLVNKFIDNSGYYKDRVSKGSKTDEGMWANYNEMRNTFESLNIDLNNDLRAISTASKMGNVTNLIMSYLLNEYYHNDLTEFSNSPFTDEKFANIFIILSKNLLDCDELEICEISDKLEKNKDNFKTNLNNIDGIMNILK